MFKLKPTYKLQQSLCGGYHLSKLFANYGAIQNKSICAALLSRLGMFLILKVRPYITGPMSGNMHRLCLGCARSVRKQTKATARNSYPLNCSILLRNPSTCKVVAKGKKLKTTVLLSCSRRFYFFPDKYRTHWTGNIRLLTIDLLKIALQFPRLCLCLFQTAMSYRLWDAFCYPKS